jgi:hypothetical protein
MPETLQIPDYHQYMRLVPYELRDLVCMCDNVHGYTTHANGFSHACRNCKKYFRYVVRKCVHCSTPYVQTFTHPLRCIYVQECFSCLNKQDRELCKHENCERGRGPAQARPEDLVLKERVTEVKLVDIAFDF